jgi:hypothetical protein
MNTKILLSISILIALVLIVLVILRVIKNTRVNKIWDSLKTDPNHITFSADMVAALPAPVGRYFLHASALLPQQGVISCPGDRLRYSIRLFNICALVLS